MCEKLDHLRRQSYRFAEQQYRRCYNEHHERIRPYADFDEAAVVRWGRLWLLTLCVGDYINGNIDPGGPSFEEKLDDAFTADFDRVLEGMYG